MQVLLAQAQQIPARLAQHGRGIVHHPAEFLGQIIEQQSSNSLAASSTCSIKSSSARSDKIAFMAVTFPKDEKRIVRIGADSADGCADKVLP
jgi:hypothetical protein